MINTKPKLKGKILSLLTAFAMVTALIPTLPAFATTTDNYGGSAFTVTTDVSGGCSYSSPTLTISKGGTYTIKQTSGTSSSTSDTIQVTATDDVTIILAGVNIATSGSTAPSSCPLYLYDAGNVTLTLADGTTNTLNASAATESSPGIYAMSSNSYTLTINGTGTLVATGYIYWPGICSNGNGGKIVIDNGNITANSGGRSPGIGSSSSKSSTGGITINGGTVTASGGEYGAGIGGYPGENITITGGTVTATGGHGAGIGGCAGKNGSNITITGGTVTASSSMYGAGIGGGGTNNTTLSGGSGSNITITGGYITASGYTAIGQSKNGSSSDISITGGYFGSGTAGSGTSGKAYNVSLTDGYTAYTNRESTASNYKIRVLSTDWNASVTYNKPDDVEETAPTDENRYSYGTSITPETTCPYTYDSGKYKQAGWSLTENSTTITDSFYITEDTTLYPVFARTFKDSGTSTDIELTYGETYSSDTAIDLDNYLKFVDSMTFSSTNGKFTYTKLSGDLPSGLTFNEDSGTITGTPEAASSEAAEVSFNVTDSTPYISLASLDSTPAAVTGTLTLTFTVAKANPVVSAPTAATDLVYTGSAQALVTVGTTSGGTMYYSTDNENWSTEIPTGTDAETYTVYYKVVGNNNYNDVDAASVPVTIAKATPATVTFPTASGVTYGATLSQSTLSNGSGDGTFAWTDGTTVPTVGNSGYSVTFTPRDANNYDYSSVTLTQTVEIKVTQATPTVSLSEKTETYTGSPISIGTATVTLVNDETYDGSVTYTYYTDSDCNTQTTTANSGASGDGAAPVNVGTYYVKASIAEQTNYTAAESTAVSLVINKADSSFDTAPTAATNLVYDSTAQNLISGGAVTGGTLEYCTTENGEYSTTVPTGTDAGDYTFYYKVVGDDNHNDTNPVQVKVSIAKLPISLTWNYSDPFVYDGEPHTVTAEVSNKCGDDEITLTYSDNEKTIVGDYTAKVTEVSNTNYTVDGANTTLDWSIVQSTSSTNSSVATYKGEESTNIFTYGDTITVTATITATGNAPVTAANSLSTFSFTELNKGYAAVFNGATQVSEPVAVTSGQQIELTVKTTDLGASATAHTLTLKYYGDNNMDATTQDFNVTVNKAKPAAVVFPTASEITYGATLSESELVDGAGDGTFAWDAPTTVPTVNNGGYSVTFTPNDMDNYDYSDVTLTKTVEIKVNQATPQTVVFPTASDITYGATLSTSELIGGAGDGKFEWTDGSIVPTVTNGGYSVTFTPNDTDNYDYSGIDLTKTVEITVAKADQAAPGGLTVTQPSESSSTGTIAGVTIAMQYSIDGKIWTDVESDPLTVNPGTLYIRYAADDNHNAGAAAEIKISASDPSYTTPSGLTATYGDTLADVTLPTADNGVWTWQDDTATTVGNAGTNTFTAVFTPYDGNYNTVTVDVNIDVAQAQPEYDIPSGLTAVYGQTLADVDLPSGWAWVDSTQSVGEIGDNTFAAAYNKDDSGNYTTITAELTVTVELIELTVSEAPTASKIKKGKTLSKSTLSGGVVTADGTEVSGTWSWLDGDEVMSKADTYERTAVFTADDEAYGTVEATVSVKVYTTTTGGGSSSGSSSTDTSDTSDTSSDSSSTPNVTTAAVSDGTIIADTSTADAGDTVTVTVTPDEGYVVETVTVTDEDGNEIEVTANDDGTYAFVMPATAVSVSATFTESDDSSDDNADDTSSGMHVCPSEKFGDVDTSLWYHEYIDYALENGLMTGTSSEDFEPNTATTRGMIVTILYRLEGEPTATAASDFTDVVSGAWYTDAVAWAAENGIVNGYDNGKFGANDTITREQTAAILYRYAGYKGYDTSASGDITAYTDADAVSGYAVTAMQWAVGTGLITGKDDNTLSPQSGATRAETAAMLARFIEAE